MREWTRAALDLLYPALCPVCGALLGAGRRDPLCGGCWAGMARLGPPWCPRCGRPPAAVAAGPGGAAADGLALDHRLCPPCRREPPPYHWARAAALYAGPVREALHAFKFGGRRALARPLAALLVEQCGAGVPPDVDALVPVPLSPARQQERGFNQAALLAEGVGLALGRPVRAGWLRRRRPTRPQSELTAEERWANVRDAFRAGPAVAGRHLVVLDDVITTGATVGACARALRQAGARAVGVLAVARVP